MGREKERLTIFILYARHANDIGQQHESSYLIRKLSRLYPASKIALEDPISPSNIAAALSL